MKIIFICGSLEPGLDGVGDYTRKIACELIRHGNEVGIVALNDKDVRNELNGMQKSGGITLPVLRLPSNLSPAQRYKRAGLWIEDNNPEWISLQFVPFAFHPKGLLFGFSKYIHRFTKGRKLHIMFHELWIGRTNKSSIKTRVLSYLQQIQIKNIFKVLKPALVHTHLPILQLKLKKMGVVAKPLPLFSNINVTHTLVTQKCNDIFRFAFFSQVGTSKSILDFINKFCIHVNAKGLSSEMFLLGGNEKKIIIQAKVFQNECPQLIRVCCTGFLNEPEISGILGECDLGITPVPRHALGKSGSVAAFLAHGVPVAAPVVHEEDFQLGIGFFNNREIDSIIINPIWEDFQQAKKEVLFVNKEINISTISKLFYSDLIDKNNL